MQQLLAAVPVLVLRLSMQEWRPGLRPGSLPPSHIYHRLKHPKRFELMRTNRSRYLSGRMPARALTCDGQITLGHILRKEAQCCDGWRACRFAPPLDDRAGVIKQRISNR
jgi:hypothetical protein